MRLQFYHNARETVAAAQKRGLIKFPTDAKELVKIGIDRGWIKPAYKQPSTIDPNYQNETN